MVSVGVLPHSGHRCGVARMSYPQFKQIFAAIFLALLILLHHTAALHPHTIGHSPLITTINHHDTISDEYPCVDVSVYPGTGNGRRLTPLPTITMPGGVVTVRTCVGM